MDLYEGFATQQVNAQERMPPTLRRQGEQGLALGAALNVL